MRRGLITTLAIGCAATTALPVLADAPADTGRAASMSVTTTLPGGRTLTLDVMAAKLAAGPRLVVDTTTCDDNGCVADAYAGMLGANDLAIDPSANVARLDTTLAGRQLSIQWHPAAGSGLTVGPGSEVGDSAGLFGSDFVGSSSDATVLYDGFDCSGTGGVGNAVVINASVDGRDEASPLAALDLPDGTVFRC